MFFTASGPTIDLGKYTIAKLTLGIYQLLMVVDSDTPEAQDIGTICLLTSASD